MPANSYIGGRKGASLRWIVRSAADTIVDEINHAPIQTMNDTTPVAQLSGQIDHLLQQAQGSIIAGQNAAAEVLYRQVLSHDSFQLDALCGLATIALRMGQQHSGLRLLERATVRGARNAALWNEIGTVRFGLTDFVGARSAFIRAIALMPNQAIYAYHLGVAERDCGRASAAASAFARAAALDADHEHALSDLSRSLQTLGRTTAAEGALRTLLARQPAQPLGWHNYGALLGEINDPERERCCYIRAIESDPAYVPSLYNLGAISMVTRRYNTEVDYLKRTLTLAPDHAPAWNNLGCAWREQLAAGAATNAFRRGYQITPMDRNLGSNIIMTLAAMDGPAGNMFAYEWGRQFPRRTTRTAPRGRGRLKIGYVSPDFRHHSCAYFLEPLFAMHDRNLVEIHAYSDVAKPDRQTAVLKQLVDQWRDTPVLDDAALAGQIAEDGIDILIDLAGHTSNNRLRMFARQPAPIQVSWLGFNASTGLQQIDWKLADRWIAPSPDAEQFAEGLWLLDRLAHCWRPPAGVPTCKSGDRPVSRKGVIFGSFNALHKLGDETLTLWGRLLASVPGSRLHLKGGAGMDVDVRRKITALMEQQGVAACRILIDGWSATTQSHLAAYNRIDIALDPFPYNGTTTTCEALWMGVPVVTLAGRRMLSRIGVSLLAAVGLDDLIARDQDDYVAIAAALAADHDRRRDLHRTLRDRMAASPLRDEAGFARAMEDAFLRMARGEQPPAV